MKNITPGNHVAYSVQFLRSIGMSHSDMAHARGIVKELWNLGQTTLAKIEWNADMPENVNTKNLAIVGLNTKFSQC